MTAPDGRLGEALASRYPDLTGKQRRKLEDLIVGEIAAAIERGDQIGTIVPLPDGSFELSFFTVEHNQPDQRNPQ